MSLNTSPCSTVSLSLQLMQQLSMLSILPVQLVPFIFSSFNSCAELLYCILDSNLISIISLCVYNNRHTFESIVAVHSRGFELLSSLEPIHVPFVRLTNQNTAQYNVDETACERVCGTRVTMGAMLMQRGKTKTRLHLCVQLLLYIVS